jgi:hypothetical protein
MFQFRVGTPPELKSTYYINSIKMKFTLTAVVKSNAREIGFRGLF